MNQIKRTCALLLAIVLTLGVALQSGIGGVFAEHTQETEQITEPTIEPIMEPEDETETTGYREVVSYAETKTEKAEVMAERTEAVTEDGKDAYIYFDLAAGNVNIGKTTYTGYVFVNGTQTKVTGQHKAENKYYVYQSNSKNKSETGYVSDDFNKTKCRIPEYTRVHTNVDVEGKTVSTKWTNFITNNTDVYDVSRKWADAAIASGREETSNYITFEQNSGYTADVTIDNIWTTHHQASTSRTTGGIGAHLDNMTGTAIHLQLKGDNRVGCVHYSADTGSGNIIEFNNGETTGTPGSITVADFPSNFKANHWNSAIGAADNPANTGDMSDGIVINGGIIYAGTTPEDNCTAIGGGGNNYGGVNIGGGTVTAVVSSTGTAIGGGIGYGDAGGDTDITITDGTIYAYNLGIVQGVGDGFAKFIPAAAIGGGGSRDKDGNKNTNINISGGTVYAQSMGGAAIGGGCSAAAKGGPANINISGGTIIAKSTTGKYGQEVVSAGVSIGGGTGKTGGGSVDLNISGENTILRTGSIGGGKTTGTGNIGSAKVNISGGDITGQVIMAGTGDENNYCEFTMTGGIIHDTDVINGNTIENQYNDPKPDVKIQYLEKNGGAVWMDDSIGVTNITGGTIEKCTAYRGGAVYMTGGTFTLSENGKIFNNKVLYSADDKFSGRGGGVYVTGGTANINGGAIDSNAVQVRGGGLYVTGEGEKKGEVKVSNGSIKKNTAGLNESRPDVGRGGGVYLEGGDFTMTGGNITDNIANYGGGGVYLAKGEGIFTLNGENAIISHNTATSGGGIYLYVNPYLNQGRIEGNIAKENGGGMYISDCPVMLEPEKDVFITGNKAAQNGAGIYIHGSSGSSGSSGSLNSKVDAVSSATSTQRVGLLVPDGFPGKIHFTNNVAEESGGAVCVDVGRFYLESDNVTVTGNRAKNGGGVAVLKGNFNISAGSIGENNGANIATENGGGVYVSDGEVWFKGGRMEYNHAKNGGGAYIAGNYSMTDGEVKSNTATNGGGIYVNDGTVTMYGGKIDSNTSTESGGGMYISSTEKDALVDIFSGSVSNNQSKSGGGVSVISNSDKAINVTVGVDCVHPNLEEAGADYTHFLYPAADDCGKAHIRHTNHIPDLTHSSCPQVIGNVASENGGGFFLSSFKTNLVFYCITERGNTAQGNSQCYNMDVRGGNVVIGDSSYDHTKDDPVKGNIIMDSSILVEGGTVDVYGKMDNPKFTNDVTVDIKQDSDHYIDHRLTKQKDLEYYKVHYYENFKGDGDTPTGLYIARQYPDLDHDHSLGDKRYDFTIMSSIFSHPGYKIVGWNTKPDDTGDKYEVNETYNLKDLDHAGKIGATNSGKEDDNSLLVIYAIWERSGYVLKFDPNVGKGETYTGTMENQRVTVGLLDGSQTLNKNQFKRPGYKFAGWTLISSPTDADTVYEDGQEITKNFTEEDGATVTLYANWKPCDHMDFLTYSADGNILTQSCSNCGGHSATAIVSAVNCVYDEKTHLAAVNYSSNWLGDQPEISYEMAEDANWDDKDEIDDNWKTDSKPLHAGNYTAKIIVEDVTAQTEYTISPIKWETPEVPEITFRVEKSGTIYNSVIKVTRPIGNNIMYKITHLPNNGAEQGVDGYPNWQSSNEFANIPYGKYYYFYAKACEDRDHIESDPSKSAAYLTTGGNIVYIENGDGIKVEPKYGEGAFTYTVSAAEGYHLRGYRDNLTSNNNDSIEISPTSLPAFVKPIPGVESGDAFIKEGGITITKDGNTGGTYTYILKLGDDKVAYHQITLKFSGAAKDASVSHKVTDGEVFGDFNGKATSISRDSAFTAQFTVSDYIPDEYTAQALSFSEALPAGTTIIMKADGGYWYYNFNLGTKNESIDLTNFTAMGGKDKFSFSQDENAAKTFTYQFIVDFSKTKIDDRITIDSDKKLEVSLSLTAKDVLQNYTSQKAPDIPTAGNTHISLGIKSEAEFTLNSGVAGKSATLNCAYNPSVGDASIWNGRKTALILTAPETAPADLTLTAVIAGNTTLYTMNSDRKFIIPLDEIDNKEVNITLNSYLFGSSQDLEFTAEWYVSEGRADKSPLNGYNAATCGEITFSCEKDVVPSVRIDGTTHRCSVGGQLSVDVNYADIPIGEKTITAYLQSKNGEQYVDTGAKKEISHTTGTGDQEIEFSMGQMPKGSYRILVIVQESGANILQVPYYFVIV